MRASIAVLALAAITNPKVATTALMSVKNRAGGGGALAHMHCQWMHLHGLTRQERRRKVWAKVISLASRTTADENANRCETSDDMIDLTVKSEKSDVRQGEKERSAGSVVGCARGVTGNKPRSAKHSDKSRSGGNGKDEKQVWSSVKAAK